MADRDAWRARLMAMEPDDARRILRAFDTAPLTDDAPELALRLTELVAAARELRLLLATGRAEPTDVALAADAEGRVESYWWRRWQALNALQLPNEPQDAALVSSLSGLVWRALAYLVLVRVYYGGDGVMAYVAHEQRAHAEWLAAADGLVHYEGRAWAVPAPVGMQTADLQRLYLLLGHSWRLYTYADAPLLSALLRRVRERTLLMTVLESDAYLGTPPIDSDDVILNEIRAYSFGYQFWLLGRLQARSFDELLAAEPTLATMVAQVERMSAERLCGMFDSVRPAINGALRLAWVIPGAREVLARKRRCAPSDIDETALLQVDMERYMHFLDTIGTNGAIQALVRSDEANTRNIVRMVVLVDHIRLTFAWADFDRHVIDERYVGGECMAVHLRTVGFAIAQILNAYAVVANGALYAVPSAEAALGLFFWLSRASAYAHAFPALYRQLAIAPPAPPRGRAPLIDDLPED